MAQLTLSERSELQSNARFQQRLLSAVTKTAKYWIDYPVDQYAKYNVAVKKRKEYARRVLVQGIQNPSYAGAFLSAYDVDITGAGVLEDDQLAFDKQTNQLSDTELTTSFSNTYTFDGFAGVETGDDTKQINL